MDYPRKKLGIRDDWATVPYARPFGYEYEEYQRRTAKLIPSIY
jgi:hypothetical protein